MSINEEYLKALTVEQLRKAIDDIGNHPLAERFVRELRSRTP